MQADQGRIDCEGANEPCTWLLLDCLQKPLSSAASEVSNSYATLKTTGLSQRQQEVALEEAPNHEHSACQHKPSDQPTARKQRGELENVGGRNQREECKR